MDGYNPDAKLNRYGKPNKLIYEKPPTSGSMPITPSPGTLGR